MEDVPTFGGRVRFSFRGGAGTISSAMSAAVRQLLALAALLGLLALPILGGAPSPGRVRLIVLTDISSLTPGVREPDDGQSMVRLMLYTNEIEIEGLIASSCMQHGQVTRPELIREVIAAYAKDRPSLIRHDRAYPPAEKLLECVKAGQPVAGPRTSVFDSIGEGKDTEASEWIIRAAYRRDSRPLWVIVWGGSADLAQALWKVRETRSPERLTAFVRKLRVHTVGDQDSTGPWIRKEFPDLFVLRQGNSMRGMYHGGDTGLSSPEWVEKSVNTGRGALGTLYPNYNGGDIWGRVRGVKEGDTPSFLGLIPNGLRQPEELALGGWGGRFQPVEGNPKRWGDAVDDYPGAERDRAPGMATVYRWRPAYQADFVARLDWCVKPRAEANHPPRVTARSSAERTGEGVTLEAIASDPDSDKLTYEWSVYPGSPDAGRFDDAAARKTRFTPAPNAARPIHLLLTVRDSGSPPLTRYARVTVR